VLRAADAGFRNGLVFGRWGWHGLAGVRATCVRVRLTRLRRHVIAACCTCVEARCPGVWIARVVGGFALVARSRAGAGSGETGVIYIPLCLLAVSFPLATDRNAACTNRRGDTCNSDRNCGGVNGRVDFRRTFHCPTPTVCVARLHTGGGCGGREAFADAAASIATGRCSSLSASLSALCFLAHRHV